MAKKSLGGAKYFEAMGRRDTSLGIPPSLVGICKRRINYPTWVREAYLRGRMYQIDCIPKGVITKDQYFNDPIV